MVRVYFTNGHSAAVSSATTVDIEMIFRIGAAADGVAGLICKDKQGKIVGQFKVVDIIGYEID